jgi:hypothetical protein
MATLTSAQLATARQNFSPRPPGCTKTVINASVQAVETFIAANTAAISSAIDAASGSVTFTAVQKSKVVAAWALVRYEQDH